MINLDNLTKIIESILGILAIFGVTIEVLPIKINPLGWLGDKINKSLNTKIAKIEDNVNNLENKFKDFQYNEDMKELRTIKNRIHAYGMLIRKGEELSMDTLKSAIDDLDVYDGYKDTYKYMIINGKKVKINGEVEADRTLIQQQMQTIKGGK